MQLIDINGNGLIEYHEFVAALQQFGPAELSDSQIYDVMRVMDLNNDNCIEMYEFVKRFEVNQRCEFLSCDCANAAAVLPTPVATALFLSMCGFVWGEWNV